MFDQGGAAFHPIARVQVEQTLYLAYFGFMDVTADDAIDNVSSFLDRKREP